MLLLMSYRPHYSLSTTVQRVLQVGVINSILDIAATGLGFVEGNLSRETATSVGGFAALTGIYQYVSCL